MTSQAQSLAERIAENPFYVLGLETTCTRQEVEREGQKLLAMLQLEVFEAQSYVTPVGPRPRTPELIRMAMAELREPKRRLLHELLASLRPEALVTPVALQPKRPPPFKWYLAPHIFGFGPKRSSGL